MGNFLDQNVGAIADIVGGLIAGAGGGQPGALTTLGDVIAGIDFGDLGVGDPGDPRLIPQNPIPGAQSFPSLPGAVVPGVGGFPLAPGLVPAGLVADPGGNGFSRLAPVQDLVGGSVRLDSPIEKAAKEEKEPPRKMNPGNMLANANALKRIKLAHRVANGILCQIDKLSPCPTKKVKARRKASVKCNC